MQRLSFGDGRRLAISGTTTPDMVTTLFDFDTALRKVKDKGQFVFDPQKGEHVNPKTTGNLTTWNCSVELQHTEADQP